MNKDIKTREENESVSCWVEDGILYQVYKKGSMDMATAKDSIDAKIAVCGNKDYPALIDIRNIKSATKEAREYVSGEIGTRNISMAAIIAPTVVSKLIGTFFITFNKPPVKIKLFTDEQEAVKWLKSAAAEVQ